jgi:hypothetical protein
VWSLRLGARARVRVVARLMAGVRVVARVGVRVRVKVRVWVRVGRSQKSRN